MSNHFAPLAPNRPASTEGPLNDTFRLKIVPQAAAKQVFTPLRSSGGSEADPSPAPAAFAVPPCAQAAPVISLEREGERIARIQIKCGCGQLIELNCVY